MHFSLTDLAADITQNSAESGAREIELAIWETDEPERADGPALKEFRFYAGDNGKGMTGTELDRYLDPFATDGVKHPGRKVGLGLPFLVQTAVDSGGGWRISTTKKGGETALRYGPASETGATSKAGPNKVGPNKVGPNSVGLASKAGVYTGGSASGTSVEAWFDLGNVDTPPVGDIPGLFRLVLLFSGPEEIIIKRSRKVGSEKKTELDYEIKKSELMEALGGNLEDLSSLVLLGKYLRSLEGIDN